MRQSFRKLAAVAGLALFAATIPVYPVHAAESTSIEAEATSLEPGEYVWQPENSAEGDVVIVVSLSQQMAYVYRGEGLIGASTISSGKAGHETPTGTYEILQKRREHYSNRYNNAPMPFMQRLTWSGVALHGGQIPGYPASHGCVRLPNAFARQLFGVTELGATVHIVDRPLSSDEALAIATNNIRVGAPVEMAGGLD
jgi:lipoprotein-anchoring transpeptidase ErfK/SrfK